jgi:hypothetical protein
VIGIERGDQRGDRAAFTPASAFLAATLLRAATFARRRRFLLIIIRGGVGKSGTHAKSESYREEAFGSDHGWVLSGV